MADWFVSSAAYSAIPVWAPSTAYTVGQIVRPVAPAAGREYPQRCTTAGTSGASEPSWNFGDGVTTASGGAVFTNVAGQSAYGWGAAAKTLASIGNWFTNRPAAGDRIFVSSDHSESFGAAVSYSFGSAGYGLIRIISVNRAGSVPPAAADEQTGAALTVTSGNFNLEALTNVYWQGFSFSQNNGTLQFNLISGTKGFYFKNCTLNLTSTAAGDRMLLGPATLMVWDNTTVKFGHIAQYIYSSNGADLVWINTPSALQGAIVPTSLFTPAVGVYFGCTCRGVDLSALTTTLVTPNANADNSKFLFDSCRIASGVVRLAAPGSNSSAIDVVELVNCYDGTNVLNERYTAAGAVTTDRSVTLASGAQDDVGNYSLKLVSSSRADKSVMPLDCFAFDVENTSIGASKTATVEIISSASLNSDDISLLLEYMGTSGSPIASFVTSLPSVLTAGSALPTSSNTWNNPPATPVKQLLQVTFTPQRAGRVRGLARLGKLSTTAWVNPQITIV